jgi:hypothetical protein
MQAGRETRPMAMAQLLLLLLRRGSVRNDLEIPDAAAKTIASGEKRISTHAALSPALPAGTAFSRTQATWPGGKNGAPMSGVQPTKSRKGGTCRNESYGSAGHGQFRFEVRRDEYCY